MVNARVVLGLGVVVLAGCNPGFVDQCREGYAFDATHSTCVLASDGGIESGVDAGDAGRDAALDAHVPCNGACTGATPHCLASGGTETCVGCTGESDCSGTTPHCEPTSHACVACVASTDCTTAAAARCDTTSHACAACTADADCTRLTATPVCDEARGACVACTGDTEAARCGANACRRSDGTCTTTARGSLDVCGACEADSECPTGQHCVHHVFMGTDVGAFCFLDATGGCGDTVPALRPYSTRSMLTSVDGASATYCMPPTATTCQGLADTRSVTCTSDAMCGLAGQADGICPTTGTGAGLCSYGCLGAVDCAGTATCGGVPQHCRP